MELLLELFIRIPKIESTSPRSFWDGEIENQDAVASEISIGSASRGEGESQDRADAMSITATAASMARVQFGTTGILRRMCFMDGDEA
jgi:hypothetical protein